MRTILKFAFLLSFITISSSLLAQPLTVTPSSTPVSCYGGNDGSASVSVSGGTPPYTYQWYYEGDLIPGANTSSINGVAGNYIVRVKDAVNTKIDQAIVITEPSSITIFAVNTTNLTCNGNSSGIIDIDAIPGTGSLEYSVNNGASYSSSSTINGLPASASYRIIVRDDNLCTKSWVANPVALTEPTALSIVIDSQTSIKCKGGSDGDIKVTGSGGTGLLDYTLKKSGVVLSTLIDVAGGTQVDFSGLTAGDYTVEVTDDNACGPAITSTITLTEPAVALSVGATHTNATGWCRTDGTITATAAGGTSPYRYSQDGITFTAPQAGPYTFTALSPNTYTITVLDANDCIATVNRTVGPDVINATVTQTDPACYGGTGSLRITAPVGGTGGGYQFSKTGANPWNLWVGVPINYTNLPSSPAPGTPQTIYMKDGSTCPPRLIGTYNIVSPAKLSAVISGTTAICPGGSATVSIALSGSSPWNITYTDGTTPTTVNNIVASPYTFNVSPAVTTTYTVTAMSNASGCTALPADLTGSAIITINTLPAITTQPTNQTTCVGTPVTFTVVATGSGLSYQWRKGGVNILGATSASYTIASPVVGDAGNYDVVVTGTCPPSVTSSTVTLTVNQAPAITTQPISQSVCVGNPVTFTVVATGPGLTYQWRKGGANITGATSASYTIPATVVGDAGNYDVVVSGTCSPAATSSIATLTVNTPPAITTQPANQAVCVGSSATFTVVATGASLTYQWRKNGGNIPGATGSSYTIAATVLGDAGNYDVVISGTCPPSATSNIATLSFLSSPAITTQPSNQTVCEGSSVTFSVVATGDGLTYQWRKGGINIPGATSSSYTIPATVVGDAGNYDLVVSGTCSPSVTSSSASLTINTAPAITTQPTDQTVCLGDGATFTVVATGTSLTYQWRKGGVNIPGATAASYTIPVTVLGDAGSYDVVVSGTCTPSATSNAVTLTINTAPAITTQPTNQTTCVGVPVTFNVVATGAGLTYQWRKEGLNIAGATSSSYTIASPVLGDAGNYDVVISGTCPPSVTSSTATLTINTPPSITTQPTNQAVCAGNPVTFNVVASGAGLTYQWRKGGVNIPGATASSYTIPATVVGDAGSFDVVVSGTCSPSVTSNSVTLTINTAPAITNQPTNQTTCLGSSATFTVVATGTGLGYQWRKEGIDIPGATGASYTIPVTVLGDAGNYDVVISGTCVPPVTSNTVTLTINTPPAITTNPIDQTVCSGDPVTFNVVATGAGLTYQWRKGGVNIPGATSSSYTILSTVVGDAGSYDVVVSGTCAPSATSTAATLTINTAPAITTQPTDQAVCLGSSVTFDVVATGAGLSYQWRKGGANILGATGASYTIPATVLGDAGSYDVVISGTCAPPVTSNAVTLTINTSPAITTQPTDLTVCSGSPSTFTVVATGAGLTYQWRKNGINIPTATAATYTILNTVIGDAGNYDVVISGTCPPAVTSNVAVLTVNASPTASVFAGDAAICLGGTTPLTVTITGGTSPYVVTYSDGTSNTVVNPYISGTDINVSPLVTTTYTLVSVVDANTCSSAGLSGTPTITVNNGPTASVLSGTATVCSGTSADLFVNITGGASPYSVVYNDGTSDITVNGYTSGSNIPVTPFVTTTYTLVSVTDANGCLSGGLSGTATITVNPVISWDKITLYNVNCHDEANGKIEVEVSGTPLPYLFSKDSARTWENNGGIFDNLVAGDYYLAVKDGNNCVHILGVPPVAIPVPILNPDKVEITSISLTDPSCNGVTDGSVNVTAIGGEITTSGSLRYFIDNDLLTINTTGVFNGLSGGDHIVSVIDDNDCRKDSTITLIEPEIIQISAIPTDITCNGLVDGQIVATATGGSGNYTYTLLPGGLVTNNDGNFTGLSAGTYNIQVTDDNACPSATTPNLVVNEPTLFTFGTATFTPILCNGGTSTITLTTSGGTTPISYSITDGVNPVSNNTGIFSDLIAGSYDYTITDANTCNTFTGTLVITEPTALSFTSIAVTQITSPGADDGTITATANGGTGNLTYTLTPGTALPQTIAAGNPASFVGLTDGSYTVHVEDENGCAIDSAGILISGMDASLTVHNVSCFGGSDGWLEVTIDGGILPYDTVFYQMPANTLLPDGNDLAIGDYKVVVTDGAGKVITLLGTITEPAVLTASVNTITDPLCTGDSNGKVLFDIAGGTLPYTITWTGGSVVGNEASGLLAGTYDFTITDGNSCTQNINDVIVNDPLPLVLNVDLVVHPSLATSSDGSITVSIAGGTGSITYKLYDGTMALLLVQVDDGQFINLASGSYFIEALDANGCTIISSEIILSGMTITVTPFPVSCNGGNDGFIQVDIVGGLQPIDTLCTLLLSTGDIVMPGLTDLQAGDYKVTITNAAGNVVDVFVSVLEPEILNATLLSSQDPTCFGGSTGIVTFDITGGNPGYTVTWESGSSAGNIASGLTSGIHNFTISDTKGCTYIYPTPIELFDPAKIIVTQLTQFDPLCNGDNTGRITIAAEGGTGALTYNISGTASESNTTGLFENLIAGVYDLAVTDDNGCIANTDEPLRIILTEPTPIIISALIPETPLTCPNVPVGFAHLEVTGGTPDYTYLWSNLNTSPNLDGVVSGTYTVKITDAHGCIVTKDIVIPGPPMLVPVVQIDTAKCNERMVTGVELGRIQILPTTTGGNGSFSDLIFNWDYESQTGPLLTNISGGNYKVTITDTSECVYDFTYNVPSDPDFYMDAYGAKDSTICYGENIILDAISNGPDDRIYTYKWSEIVGPDLMILGSGRFQDVNPLSQTQYFLEIENDGGCYSRDTVTIGVYPEIDVHIPMYVSVVKDSIISVLPGEIYNIDVNTKSIEYATEFSWTPDVLFTPADTWNSTVSMDVETWNSLPKITMKDPDSKRLTEFAVVKVFAETEVGCIDSLKLYARLVNNLYFGNVFSPNGDGLNDLWVVPKDYLFPDLEIKIYNRWGSLVWSAKGTKAGEGWNGKTESGNDLPVGTYYYVITFNAKSKDKNWKPVTGSVTIVR